MQWITVALAMTAAACLTLAAVHLQIWIRQRDGLTHLAFALAAISCAAFTPLEFLIIRAETPEQYATAVRWVHIPGTAMVLSLVWFTWRYFGTGRRWLAGAVVGARLVALVANFASPLNLNFRTITDLRQVAIFGGERVASAVGDTNPWSAIGTLTNLLVFLYILDASVRLWRKGGRARRRAAVVGGALLFYVLVASASVALVMTGLMASPFLLSVPFVLPILAMSYELSLDVVLARKLSIDHSNLASIVASSDDAIIGRTLAGTITSWNAGATNMYGYSAGEMIGRHVSVLVPAERRDELARILEQISRGSFVDHIETKRLTKDGRQIDVSLTVSPIVDEVGGIIGASTTARDITSRKRDGRAVESLTGRLLVLQDAERQRIAAELHDGLGQSLAIIKNRAAMAERAQSDQALVLEQLGEIQATATAAILEVRQIAHNLRPYELDRLGLRAAIESMVERISDANAITLSTDVDEIAGLLSPEAETSIYRIVQESLNNVVKHSQAAAARIEIKKKETQLVISVQDNGTGILPATAAAKGPAARGFGLIGIAERVRTLNGTLAVDSSPGRGTTLTIRLEIRDGRVG